MSIAALLVLLLFLHHALTLSHEIEYTSLIDQIVKDAAMRTYHTQRHHRTAVHYRLSLPPSISGVSAVAVRYRTGSLWRYGDLLEEFSIPPGIVTRPHEKHVVVVHENLGKFSWLYESYMSSNARSLRLLSPVLGLLFYNATTFRSSTVDNLNIVVTKTPIIVNFSSLVEAQLVQNANCVVFQLDGNISVTTQPWNNVCITWQQGHFALMEEQEVVDGTGESRTGTKVSTWKLVAMGVIIGTAGALLIGLLVVALVTVRRKKVLLAEMEMRAYEEEALRVSMVGHVRAPTATGARTKPSIEDEFAH